VLIPLGPKNKFGKYIDELEGCRKHDIFAIMTVV
jgi:hypothetical protein